MLVVEGELSDIQVLRRVLVTDQFADATGASDQLHKKALLYLFTWLQRRLL